MVLLDFSQALELPLEALRCFSARDIERDVEMVTMAIDTDDVEEWHVEPIDLGREH